MSLQSSAGARLATALAVLKDLGVTNRDTHLQILRGTLENHTHYSAVWAAWRHDALDGRDPGHADIQYPSAPRLFRHGWRRYPSGTPSEIPPTEEKPAACYQFPIVNRKPIVVAPYESWPAEKRTLLATVAAPIMLEQQCMGVAGVDFCLEKLGEEDPGQTSPSMQRISEDLGAGIVVLDVSERVLACSPSAASMLNKFTSRTLELGKAWPKDLQFAAANDQSLEEVVLQQCGVVLTVKRSRQTNGQGSVAVVTISPVYFENPPLSAREDEVMHWLSEGKSNDEIGIILSISPHTVKNHLDRIYRKIGVANRHAATLAWSRSQSPAAISS